MSQRPIRPAELLLAVTVAAAILLPGLGRHSLVDPWEGHYAEVGRRVLADDDWVQLRWRDEVFRSKPALTPWLIAASLRAHGLAAGGGYGGEMVAESRVAWAVRLPFALFGIGGMLAVWLMLARLVSRRAAWLGLLCLGSTPFYALVARQAITDMPMVAATAGALACFLLALGDGDGALRRWRVSALHVALGIVAVLAALQVVYNTSYFVADPSVGRGVRLTNPALWASLPFALGFALLCALMLVVWPARARRDVYLICGYALVGVGVLAKGPPGGALVVLVCLTYLVATRSWRAFLQLRIIEGSLIVLLVAAPWHVAMALRDGQPFLTEYIGRHWLARAASGVHMVNRGGEGTLSYFVHQLGIGLWPLVAVLPGALIAAARVRLDRPADNVRLFALIWAVGGLLLFTCLETKYHHYILPAVPGFAVLAALWLDDVLAGRAHQVAPLVVVGLALVAAIAADVVAQPERIVELFVYRYDRPLPDSVALGAELVVIAAAIGLATIGLCVPIARRHAAVGVVVVAVLSGYWFTIRYMIATGPHWGQRQIHETYYREREVHGVTLRYSSLAAAHADWAGRRELAVDTFVPDHVAIGTPMHVTIVAEQRPPIRLRGSVSRHSATQLWIRVPESERAAVPAPTAMPRSIDPRPTRVEVDADRLITWNLFWRSELFWTSSEIWGDSPDTRTDFGYNADSAYRAYLARPESQGRRFFLLTDNHHASRVAGTLPARDRHTLVEVDRSSNNFTLFSFRLGSAPGSARSSGETPGERRSAR